ncbi:MAG: lamin tail domain-containing protein [Candidatus Saccharimonadales bacterium]
MRRPRFISWVGLIYLTFIALAPFKVFSVSPPPLAVPAGLSLAKLKVTGSEFIMLVNNSGSLISDLSNYWLYGFNNVNPVASGVSSSTQQLPAGNLAVGQSLLLSADGGLTCGAAVTDDLSVSLTDSGGFLQLVHVSFSGGVLTQDAVDSVSWTTGSNTAEMISAVPTSTAAKETYAAYRYQNSTPPPSFKWQAATVDSSDPCQLNVTSTVVDTSAISLMPAGTEPGATIKSLQISGGVASNNGLSAPLITEVLPNPASPQTDAEDEFIELYNPNAQEFDLSGHILEAGLTSKHRFTFPAGTKLPAKSFKAFFSEDTNLTLTNSGGLVSLLGAGEEILSQTQAYGKAKEGQSWALALGKWYWTNNLTPASANIVDQGAGASATNFREGSAQGASTTGATPASASSQPAPLHPGTLAAVGSAALLYGAYEYRHDMANHLHRFRRYRAARAAAGAGAKGWTGGGIGLGLGRWQDHLRSWLSERFKK